MKETIAQNALIVKRPPVRERNSPDVVVVKGRGTAPPNVRKRHG